jgi:hypothetical protein
MTECNVCNPSDCFVVAQNDVQNRFKSLVKANFKDVDEEEGIKFIFVNLKMQDMVALVDLSNYKRIRSDDLEGMLHALNYHGISVTFYEIGAAVHGNYSFGMEININWHHWFECKDRYWVR